MPPKVSDIRKWCKALRRKEITFNEIVDIKYHLHGAINYDFCNAKAAYSLNLDEIADCLELVYIHKMPEYGENK